MSPKKAPLPDVPKFAHGGAEHREQVRSAPAVPGIQTDQDHGQKRGGRPRSFDEPTERLPIQLPESLAQELREKAVATRKTPSQVVADLLKLHLKTS